MQWYKKQDMTMHGVGNEKSLKLDLAFALDVLEEENVVK